MKVGTYWRQGQRHKGLEEHRDLMQSRWLTPQATTLLPSLSSCQRLNFEAKYNYIDEIETKLRLI